MDNRLIISIVFLLSILYDAFSQTVFIPFSDKHISYEGRIPFKIDAAELTWPGTSVRLNFKGTSVYGQFKDADTSNYYNVIVDNKIVSKIHFDTIQKTYLLVDGLSDGKHTLQLFKRTEWDKGKTSFYGFSGNEKFRMLKPSKPPKRKIEFFGNSITCGYAIEDYTNDSHFGYFENNYNAYAAITARHFNAQYHCTSKSGIGITVSWFPLIMKEMYDRLDPTDSSSKWNFSLFTPDIVVINLLQNDYWLVNMSGHEQFKNRFGTKAPDEEFIITAYKNFIQNMRSKYPKADIICMLGNMDITKKNSKWPDYVQKAVALLNDKEIFTFFVPYKETPGHPKTNEQKILADGLIQFIEKNIRW